MSQTAAGVQSAVDAKLIHENANLNPAINHLVLGSLPKSKIKIENVSREPGFFKFNIDFSKLDHEDIQPFFDCLLLHRTKIQCLDLSHCNLLGHEYRHIMMTITDMLHNLSSQCNIQKFIISPNSADSKPFVLSNNHQKLLLLETQLNSDSLSGKMLDDFLKQEGDTERRMLIPESIMGLRFFSVKKGAGFLYPWQKPRATNFYQELSLSELSKIYANLKELITECFSYNAGFCLSIFTGSHVNEGGGLFAYCENELKKNIENKAEHIDHHRVRFTLETLTWLALVISSIQFGPSNYRRIRDREQKEISNCIQAILNTSEISTKIQMLQVFQRNFIYSLTHYNPNGMYFYEELEQNKIKVNHHRFLENYLAIANERRKPIALLLSDLCQNSEKPEANPSKNNNFMPDIVVFFNNPLYREGVYYRIVIDVLLKLIESKEISENNKVFLILHCQKNLKDKSKNKNHHYKAWSLLYSLLCSNLNKEIEEFLNITDNIVDDMLNILYWRFLKKVAKLTEADKQSYEANFNSENHHLILAFRQNLDGNDNDEFLASHFDKFIQAVTRGGTAGFRKLRYDETQNPHLQTLFSLKKDTELDSKNATESTTLKSLWSTSDITLTFTDGQFKGHQLICTDNYWDMMTWGFGINCLNPIRGSYKLFFLLLYGQHRLMMLRDENGKVVAGCMLHLLLKNIHKPKPCLALGVLYHRDNWQDKKESTKVKAAISILFERLGATLGLRLGISCYAFYNKGLYSQPTGCYNKDYPERIVAGLGIFTKQGWIQRYPSAGLDNDFYDCSDLSELEHNQHGPGVIIYAYRQVSETPLSELEMSELEIHLKDRFDNGPNHIISNILDYFSGGFRTEEAAGNTLCFEWKPIKKIVNTTGEPMEPTTTVIPMASMS